MEIFVLTISDSDEILANETLTSFVFTTEEKAKEISEEFERRNQALKPLIEEKAQFVDSEDGFNSNNIRRRKWGYRRLHLCDDMTVDEMNKNFPMYTEHKWIIKEKK